MVSTSGHKTPRDAFNTNDVLHHHCCYFSKKPNCEEASAYVGGHEGVKCSQFHGFTLLYVHFVRSFFVIFFEHYSLLTIWLQITLFVLHTWVVEKPKIAWQFQTSRSLRVIM